MSFTQNVQNLDQLIQTVERLTDTYPDAEPFVVHAVEDMLSFVKNHLRTLQDKGDWDLYDLTFSPYLQKMPEPIVFQHREDRICVSLRSLVELRHQQLLEGISIEQFVLQVMSMLAYEIGKSRRYYLSRNDYLDDMEPEHGLLSKGAIIGWYGQSIRSDILTFVGSEAFLEKVYRDIKKMHMVRCHNSSFGREFVREMHHQGVDDTYQLYTVFDLNRIKQILFAYIEDFMEGNLFLDCDDICLYVDLILESLKESTKDWDYEKFYGEEKKHL